MIQMWNESQEMKDDNQTFKAAHFKHEQTLWEVERLRTKANQQHDVLVTGFTQAAARINVFEGKEEANVYVLFNRLNAIEGRLYIGNIQWKNSWRG